MPMNRTRKAWITRRIYEFLGITRIPMSVLIDSQLAILSGTSDVFQKKNRQRKFKEIESLTWKLVPLEKYEGTRAL